MAVPAAALALLAAVLFGAGVPLSKILLKGASPAALAPLFYLGSGILLALTRLLWKGRGGTPLSRRDLPWLAASTLCGGMLAPLILLWGLQRVGGLASSLLLNLEGVFTVLLAWALFREKVGGRVLAAVALAAAGAVWLTAPQEGSTTLAGALAVAASCACWGMDNNVTRRISGADPLVLGFWKSLVAGLVGAGIALALGVEVPGWGTVLGALAVGALSYGASLACFILALRGLGASRTAAYFGVAPFAGALMSILLLGERPTLAVGGAGVLMAVAVGLLLGEEAWYPASR